MMGPQKECKGFTLLEVLIALAIVVVGIIAAMQLFPVSLRQARMSAERTVTAETASSVFGEIRASGAEALFEQRLSAELLETPRDTRFFGYHTSLQSMPGAAEVQLQRITLIVKFADGREEKFVTYVARQ